VIEALIEEAEIYSGNKKHILALTTFLKAINVCEKYDLDDEFSSIVRNDVFHKSVLYGVRRGLSIYACCCCILMYYSLCFIYR
jgi:hypothetical protein